jgi:hypothetical protein
MVQRRRDPRLTRTGDLWATLRPAGQPARIHAPIIDLSKRGMLIGGGGLGVGDSLGIELEGPGFRLAGRAEVMH